MKQRDKEALRKALKDVKVKQAIYQRSTPESFKRTVITTK